MRKTDVLKMRRKVKYLKIALKGFSTNAYS